MIEFAKPGPEHEKLRRLTGAWSARIKYYPRPGAPPEETAGEYLARMDIGGYFLCREMNFGMSGYQGRGITGYDPFRGIYVGTWVDSMSPLLYPMEGDFDERGVFCETSEGPGPTGALIRLRMTTEIIDKNQMLFRMYCTNAGADEALTVEIEHTRRRFIE